MSFDRLIEEKIRAAMAAGEFDNLRGTGKPLDLTAYFATPEDLRVGYSLLKSSGFVPEEAQLLKEIESLKAQLATCKGDAEKTNLQQALDDQTLKFNLLVERYKRRPR
jgi:hypothetical protein